MSLAGKKLWSGVIRAFLLACVVIVVWAALGPANRFSDTWQLIINTGTTIVTFLIVFLIQNTQNRDTRAMQLKLDELIRAIHAVAAGKHYLDPAVTEKVTAGYAHRQPSLQPEPQGNLSEREEEILRRIAWGYSNKEIAAHFEISVKTVEAHKANTMKKLGLHSRIDIVRYALLQGWLQDN